MGIYYIIVCRSQKQYMEPPNRKKPFASKDFCQAVVYAMTYDWLHEDLDVIDCMGDEYFKVTEEYKDMTEEITRKCNDFTDKFFAKDKP